MTNNSDRSSVISYAVWFRLSQPGDDTIPRIFQELSLVTAKHWTLSTHRGTRDQFSNWYRVGSDFYLLHIEQHWSAGDICGRIRHFKLIDPTEEVMAVRIDHPEHWDLPEHGLLDRNASLKLYEWKEQASQWYYVRNS